MIRVTCALIVQHDTILLAQLGAGSNHPFQWEFPGGKIENEESGESCVKREIKEELGVEIEILANLEPVNYVYDFGEIQLIPFLCKLKSGKIKLNEHIDLKRVKWNHLQNLNMPAADKKLIQSEKNRMILKEYFREKMNQTG